MSRVKVFVISVIGVIISIVTLRRFRRRATEEEPEPDASEELSQAAEHSAAALQHARQAGEKAVRSGREKVPVRSEEEAD